MEAVADGAETRKVPLSKDDPKGVLAILEAAVRDGKTLRDANLPGAFLHGAALRKANLESANLTRADLSESQMMGASFASV